MNLNEYLQQTQKEEVKLWINHNLKNYLEKNEENQGEIEHIIDYLNSDKAPTRLKKMSYKQANANAQKWVKTLVKKGKNIVETDADVKVVLNFEDGYKLVKLIGAPAFKREGHLMSHCVASYADKDTNVYSLRDPNNDPHCTIEVNSEEDQINQVKGKGNGSIHPNYIKYVIDILKYFKINVRDSEMDNLGYSKLKPDWFKFLDEHFTGVKYCCLNGNKYFYNRSKLVRRK